MVATRPAGSKDLPPAAVPPPFKLSDIRAAIPDHCFKRSLLRSISYLGGDLIIVFSLFYFVSHVFNPSSLPAPLSWLVWAAYAVVQGSVMTGVWVQAHECGHEAWSDYPILNDIVGYCMHTPLLVPYFSWKISHAKHHARTGSMTEDEVFVPKVMEEKIPSDNPLLHTAPLRLAQVFIMLVFGWPLYMTFNTSSHKTKDFVSHFWPYCSLFTKKEHFLVILSDLGLLVWFAVVAFWAQQTSWSWVWLTYGFPMIVVNALLVGITALHHTNKDVPHYGPTEWNWLRGALATVDRDYGPWNAVLHHIGDTHVAHHLFSRMPHYHAVEATECIKKVIGEYYNYDSSNIFKALYDNTLECFGVEDKNGVFWWRPSPLAAGKKATSAKSK